MLKVLEMGLSYDIHSDLGWNLRAPIHMPYVCSNVC